MKERSDIRPYWHSADWNVNLSITMRKIHKRIHDQNTDYIPLSRFQKKHRSARNAWWEHRTGPVCKRRYWKLLDTRKNNVSHPR